MDTPTYTTKKQFKNAIQPGEFSNFSPMINEKLAALKAQYGETPYWSQFTSIPTLNLPSYFSDKSVNRKTLDFWSDMYNQYEQSAMADINQILSVIREEEYNSALQQVGRNAQAGINSDLAGNVEPGSATEFDDSASDFQTPSAVAATQARTQRALGISQMGVDFFESFLSMASEIQGLNSGMLDNAGKELSLEGAANDYVLDSISTSMPVPKDGKYYDQDGNELSDREVVSYTIDQAAKKLADIPMGRKARKVLTRAFGRYKYGEDGTGSIGLLAKYEDLVQQFTGSRWKRSKDMSSPLWSTESSDMLSKVAEGFSNIEQDIYEKTAKLRKLVLDFDTQFAQGRLDNQTYDTLADLENQRASNSLSYESALDQNNVPERSAELESERITLSKLQTEVEKLRTEAIDAAEKEFKQIQDKYLSGDKWYHVLGRLLLPVARSFVTSYTNSYFDSASSALATRQFNPKQPTQISNFDYSTRNSTNYINNPQ